MKTKRSSFKKPPPLLIPFQPLTLESLDSTILNEQQNKQEVDISNDPFLMKFVKLFSTTLNSSFSSYVRKTSHDICQSFSHQPQNPIDLTTYLQDLMYEIEKLDFFNEFNKNTAKTKKDHLNRIIGTFDMNKSNIILILKDYKRRKHEQNEQKRTELLSIQNSINSLKKTLNSNYSKVLSDFNIILEQYSLQKHRQTDEYSILKRKIQKLESKRRLLTEQRKILAKEESIITHQFHVITEEENKIRTLKEDQQLTIEDHIFNEIDQIQQLLDKKQNCTELGTSLSTIIKKMDNLFHHMKEDIGSVYGTIQSDEQTQNHFRIFNDNSFGFSAPASPVRKQTKQMSAPSSPLRPKVKVKFNES